MAITVMKPARSIGRARRIRPYSSLSASTPRITRPPANTSLPPVTMKIAAAASGIANRTRRVRSPTGYLPPKRRLRRAYSASDSSNASVVKSGHSSSRNTNSE